MTETSLIEGLHSVLANTYAIYLKTHNYHWNVRGHHFISLHKLLEEQYVELSEAVDEIAERIRALGSLVKATFPFFAEQATFAHPDETAHWQTMIADLSESHVMVTKVLSKALRLAQEDGDEVTADMMIERIDAHQKIIWMLKSTLEQ